MVPVPLLSVGPAPLSGEFLRTAPGCARSIQLSFSESTAPRRVGVCRGWRDRGTLVSLPHGDGRVLPGVFTDRELVHHLVGHQGGYPLHVALRHGAMESRTITWVLKLISDRVRPPWPGLASLRARPPRAGSGRSRTQEVRAVGDFPGHAASERRHGGDVDRRRWVAPGLRAEHRRRLKGHGEATFVMTLTCAPSPRMNRLWLPRCSSQSRTSREHQAPG